MAMIETWFNQDVKKAVKVQYLDGNVFSQDNNGNKVGVNLYDGNEPVDVAGTISANVIRADGSTVAVTGESSGNQAWVVLPQSCYAVPGIISIIIKSTDSSDVTTLCAVVSNVYMSSTDSVVDPGTIIPSIETLIAEIETVVASIPADYSDLWECLAPVFSSSTKYFAGQYVTYDGNVYRFIVDHPAGTWNSAHVNAVTLGDSISTISEVTDNLIISNRTETFGNTLTLTPLGKGVFLANGSSTNAAAYLFTGDIVLPAGTYRAGYIPQSGTKINLQVRDFTSGSDGGNLLQTSSNETFTINETKRVRCRIQWAANTSVTNYMLYPVMTVEGKFPIGFVPNYTAFDGVARSYAEIAYNYGIVSKKNDSTDLNDYTDPGFYILDSSIEYANAPAVGASMLIVYGTQDSPYRVQYFIFVDRSLIFVRKYSGNPMTWKNWVEGGSFRRNTSTITDFDDLTENGWFICTYATEYAHDPIGANNDRIVITYSEVGSSNYRVQIAMSPSKGLLYTRLKKGNPATWRSWMSLTGTSGSIITESFTNAAQTSQGENKGLTLRVMTYNICHFNNDTSVYISDDRLLNLRKMIYEAKAEMMFVQEDGEYIDSGSTKASDNYLYYPIYPNKVGSSGTTIRSKTALTSGGMVVYTNGRWARYAVYTSGDIKLLLVSTHPVANYNSTGSTSAESIAARKIQYEELIKWVNGEITLNESGTSTPVTVPEHTHCIIGIDANCSTDDDKTNLLSEVNSGHFIPANGGYIGWFITEMRTGVSIDNFLVSSNVIINSVEALNDWYALLYSDHVPVVADLTLL